MILTFELFGLNLTRYFSPHTIKPSDYALTVKPTKLSKTILYKEYILGDKLFFDCPQKKAQRLKLLFIKNLGCLIYWPIQITNVFKSLVFCLFTLREKRGRQKHSDTNSLKTNL
jgi:hypothetical protein